LQRRISVLMIMNRRSFLQKTTALGAAATLLNAQTASASVITKPGIQLYSLRDEMEKDPKATLKSVAQLGYKEIESYPGSKGFLWGMKPAEFKTYLADLGLTPVATHCGIEKDMPSLMDEAAAGGFKNVVVSWIGKEKRTNLDGFRAVAEEFNRYGELAKSRSMTFGYHNHDYPFIDMDNQTPYDILVSRTDAKLVTFELDVFWVIEPGKDPVQFFNKYPGRFSMAHIKDRDKTNAKNSVVIGQGDLSLAKMMTAGAKAGVKHFFVEVEEYGALTPIESVRQSLVGLKKIQF
jgi:sugar phosphate isomerase/epimerase